jgi:hypothetical protein
LPADLGQRLGDHEPAREQIDGTPPQPGSFPEPRAERPEDRHEQVIGRGRRVRDLVDDLWGEVRGLTSLEPGESDPLSRIPADPPVAERSLHRG